VTWERDHIIQALVIGHQGGTSWTFMVEMQNILINNSPERLLAKEDHLIKLLPEHARFPA
jgi:isochorismate synthase EntC